MPRSEIDTIKYQTWPRLPMGKWQTHSKTPQTRAKRSALSQQVTTRHIWTDAYKGTANIRQKKHKISTRKCTALERSVKYFTEGLNRFNSAPWFTWKTSLTCSLVIVSQNEINMKDSYCFILIPRSARQIKFSKVGTVLFQRLVAAFFWNRWPADYWRLLLFLRLHLL